MAASDTTADDVPSRFQVDFTGRVLQGLYRVEKKLADGGMGSVYLAHDTNLGRKVVVKVPHARFLGEAGFRRRFRREVEELVRLEHPRVVRILSQGEEDGVPYFVLQYLGGGSLEDRFRTGPQDVRAVLSWLAPVAETLDFVHARGVVHRDVKPANILFDEQGHVFLSDFGVVKALDVEAEADQTAAGTGIGSPHYMAPEQGVGRALSGASDQYALAATVFEAMAGGPPFGKGTPVEIILRKERETPPSLRGQIPAFPEACDAAVRRALSRDPAARFPSCADFARAVEAACLPAASAPSRPPLVGWLVGIATLLAVAAGVGLATDWYGLAAASAPAAEDSDAATGDTVVLVKAGQAPHRPLRLRVVPGAKEVLRLDRVDRLAQAQAAEPEASLPLPTETKHEWGIEIEVLSRDDRGHARCGWRVRNLQPPAKETPRLGINESAIMDALGGLVATGSLDDRGGIHDLEVRPGKDLSEVPVALRTAFSDMGEQIRYLMVRFPKEPVGVGAAWDVTRSSTQFGMRFHTTTSFELLEASDDRLKIRSYVAVTAPPQGFQVPGMSEGVEAKVQSFHITGSGEVVLDLDRAAPARTESTGSMTMAFTVPVGDREMAFRIESTQEEKIRRE